METASEPAVMIVVDGGNCCDSEDDYSGYKWFLSWCDHGGNGGIFYGGDMDGIEGEGAEGGSKAIGTAMETLDMVITEGGDDCRRKVGYVGGR